MCRVLIVEDNLEILTVLKLILGTSGFEVDTITNLDEVMRNIALKRPDIILMDINVDGQDGKQKCLHIKNVYPNLPVILTSGDVLAKRDFQSFGADAFIDKPFGMDDIINTINEVWERTKLAVK